MPTRGTMKETKKRGVEKTFTAKELPPVAKLASKQAAAMG